MSQCCQLSVTVHGQGRLWTFSISSGKLSSKQQERESEREGVRGGEEWRPVYLIQWQQSTIHNQSRLIHSFN